VWPLTLHVPWLGVAETYLAVVVGSASVNLTPLSAAAALLVIFVVNVTVPSAVNDAGAAVCTALVVKPAAVHRPRFVAGLPPELGNEPPTYSPSALAASALAVELLTLPTPEPRPLQACVAVLYCATFVAGAVPAV